jgi:hypothetical protein
MAPWRRPRAGSQAKADDRPETHCDAGADVIRIASRAIGPNRHLSTALSTSTARQSRLIASPVKQASRPSTQVSLQSDWTPRILPSANRATSFPRKTYPNCTSFSLTRVWVRAVIWRN